MEPRKQGEDDDPDVKDVPGAAVDEAAPDDDGEEIAEPSEPA